MLIRNAVHSMLMLLFVAKIAAGQTVSSFGRYQPAPVFTIHNTPANPSFVSLPVIINKEKTE